MHATVTVTIKHLYLLSQSSPLSPALHHCYFQALPADTYCPTLVQVVSRSSRCEHRRAEERKHCLAAALQHCVKTRTQAEDLSCVTCPYTRVCVNCLLCKSAVSPHSFFLSRTLTYSMLSISSI